MKLGVRSAGTDVPGSGVGRCTRKVPGDPELSSLGMEPIRTDFRGYEGQYVAIDARSGVIVIADKDPRVVLEKAKGRNHVVVRGRVPHADEPIYVGLG